MYLRIFYCQLAKDTVVYRNGINIQNHGKVTPFFKVSLKIGQNMNRGRGILSPFQQFDKLLATCRIGIYNQNLLFFPDPAFQRIPDSF